MTDKKLILLGVSVTCITIGAGLLYILNIGNSSSFPPSPRRITSSDTKHKVELQNMDTSKGSSTTNQSPNIESTTPEDSFSIISVHASRRVLVRPTKEKPKGSTKKAIPASLQIETLRPDLTNPLNEHLNDLNIRAQHLEKSLSGSPAEPMQ